MKSTREWIKSAALAAALLITTGDISHAEEEGVTVWVSSSQPRWEIGIGVQSWPGLADLNVASEGSFDEVGLNLSFAGHMPVRRLGRGQLYAGIDLGLMSNESDIRFSSDTLIARNGYITPSVKWMFGYHHRYSLDAGIGYYLQDVAEVASGYGTYWETQLWEDGAVGGYIGGTFDFGSSEPGKTHGVSVNLKVHFVEFGHVNDEGFIYPETLGQDAGNLFERTPEFFQKGLSVGSLFGLKGDVADVTTAITGRDPMSGQDVSGIERWLGVLGVGAMGGAGVTAEQLRLMALMGAGVVVVEYLVILFFLHSAYRTRDSKEAAVRIVKKGSFIFVDLILGLAVPMIIMMVMYFGMPNAELGGLITAGLIAGILGLIGGFVLRSAILSAGMQTSLDISGFQFRPIARLDFEHSEFGRLPPT